MEICKKCSNSNLAYSRQTTSNGMLQLKLICTNCGSYIKFLPHSERHRFADITPQSNENNHVCKKCNYFLDLKKKCQMTGEDIKNKQETCLFYAIGE